MSKPLRVFALGIIFLILPFAVQAQTTSLASLGALRTDAFPQISATMDVRDEQGRFVSGLVEENITILENQQRVEIDTIEELHPGAQFVVAINAGPAFAVRDSQAVTRYDRIREALEIWATGPQESPDDLSLLTNSQLNASHLDSPSKWLNALYEAPSDHRNASPNFQLLSQAIGVAADTPPRDGMGRAVLFITQNPEQSTIPALESLGARARQADVPVHIWMIASKSFFVTSPTIALQELAVSTGGSFFAYSGEEPIPDIESYLQPLRSVYALSYTSQITSQGAHELAIEVNTPDFETTSAPQSFELMVQPPNPILVSPPSKLYRALVSAEDGQAAYDLNEQNIEILLEFPDGYNRSLVRTTLYVDGEIVAENTRAPFDVFNWDLSTVTDSGRRMIQVEAVDELGMSQVSLETPVEITVQQPPEGIAPIISDYSNWVAGTVVFLAGAVLVIALVMLVRVRIPFFSRFRRRRKQRRRERDPVYQTVPDANIGAITQPRRKSRLPSWAHIPRLPWAQQNAVAVEPYAYLEQIFDPDAMETLTPSKPFEISNFEVTLGGDPQKASLVLEDPSVAELHARLRRDSDGNFFVQDNDSISGTWVNFMPANGKEIRIEHGDLIHIGRVGFRFKLHKPQRIFEPLILPKKGSHPA